MRARTGDALEREQRSRVPGRDQRKQAGRNGGSETKLEGTSDQGRFEAKLEKPSGAAESEAKKSKTSERSARRRSQTQRSQVEEKSGKPRGSKPRVKLSRKPSGREPESQARLRRANVQGVGQPTWWRGITAQLPERHARPPERSALGMTRMSESGARGTGHRDRLVAGPADRTVGARDPSVSIRVGTAGPAWCTKRPG
jgi:hypothetical protein